MQHVSFPAFTTMFNPIIQSLTDLGNSAALSELELKVAANMGLSDELLSQPHVRNRGTDRERVTPVSEFAYRLRWALTYLKKAGHVNNSQRGVWSFTDKGTREKSVVATNIVQFARQIDKNNDILPSIVDLQTITDNEDSIAERTWQETLIETLQEMQPDAFERLAQRVLREAGFEEVEVTGKSGDGGIDGKGIIRLNDLVGLSAVFQCKRYRNSVGAEDVRQFRGAMIGRADRAIFITTARFTPAAQREAIRDGVTAIELIDGERLSGLLKSLKLGVESHHIEVVKINQDFFSSL